MRTLAVLFISALAAAVLLTASTAAAKEKRKKKEPESHPTVITAVTPAAITIREAKAEKTLAITPSTEIYVRDKKADLAALQPGMAVSITLAMDGDKASRISATDAPPDLEPEDRKKKSRKRR
jgi:hypothetical protein